jgi:hypothetical protein
MVGDAQYFIIFSTVTVSCLAHFLCLIVGCVIVSVTASDIGKCIISSLDVNPFGLSVEAMSGAIGLGVPYDYGLEPSIPKTVDLRIELHCIIRGFFYDGRAQECIVKLL